MATENIILHRQLANQMRGLDISTAFGLVSEDTALFIASVEGAGIDFVSARHENNAVAMADGYAHATGALGIAIIGRGPAAANCMHSAIVANRTGSSVLVVVGDAPTRKKSKLGPDDKALDAAAMFVGAGLTVLRAHTSETVPSLFGEAASLASTGKAIILIVPANLFQESIPVPPDGAHSIAPRIPGTTTPRPAAIASAAHLIENMRRPLIVGGLGAHKAGAADAITALATHIGALTITTAKAKGLFAGSPYDLGILGSFSHSAARKLVDMCDGIIVFGAGLNRRTTSLGTALPAHVPIVQVDAAEDRLNKWLDVDVGVLADARLAALALTESLGQRTAAAKAFHAEDILATLARFSWADEFDDASTAHTIDARTLAIALNGYLPDNSNLVYDSGNFLGVLPLISTRKPSGLKMTSDMASVGLGLATAIGAAVGRPNEPTVLIIGDGGLLMALGELETAARLALKLVVIVMNDCAYGAELHYLSLNGSMANSVTFPDVDFAGMASALGFEVATIRKSGDLENIRLALSEANLPILLDCKINRSVQAPFLSEAVPTTARQ